MQFVDGSKVKNGKNSQFFWIITNVGRICVRDIKRVKIPLQIYPLEEKILWCLERQNTRNLGPWLSFLKDINKIWFQLWFIRLFTSALIIWISIWKLSFSGTFFKKKLLPTKFLPKYFIKTFKKSYKPYIGHMRFWNLTFLNV